MSVNKEIIQQECTRDIDKQLIGNKTSNHTERYSASLITKGMQVNT